MATRAVEPDPDQAWGILDKYLVLLPDQLRARERISGQLAVAIVLAQAELPDSARAVVSTDSNPTRVTAGMTEGRGPSGADPVVAAVVAFALFGEPAFDTLDTGNELIDGYLWIKTPGESDGECTRGLGPAGETVDPEWGLIDPAAGDWFPEQVLDLVTYANPALAGVWPYQG